MLNYELFFTYESNGFRTIGLKLAPFIAINSFPRYYFYCLSDKGTIESCLMEYSINI